MWRSETWRGLAIEPLLPGAGGTDFSLAWTNGPAGEVAALSRWLLQQGLAAFWDDASERGGWADGLPPALATALRRARTETAGHYLAQRHAMRVVKDKFGAASVPHLMFKGAHLRERIYPEPSLRPATDLDLLIDRARRQEAVGLLCAEGFELCGDSANASHEVTLAGDGVYIDLHWDLLRPGRTREPLADRFLATRQDFGTHWGADESATLFLMLVHPVITKYLTTPHASLVRVLDLFWWIEQVSVDWDAVLDWLGRAGLRTAAWLSLQWAGRFGDLAVPEDFYRRVAPGPMRQRYLRYWLDHNLPSRLLWHPWTVQLGFTLPVQDRITDAWRVVRRAPQARREAVREWDRLVLEFGK